jgi:hypothetical protein
MDDLQGVLRVTGNAFLCWAALVATASVVVHARVLWWRSVMGRHLMAYMGVMALVLDLGVVRLVTGDSWWFQLIRLLVFVGVPVVMTWRLWLQIRAQHTARASKA